MIGTNRDLAAMRAALDGEINRLIALKTTCTGTANSDYVDGRIASLSRERAALYTAIVNRRFEAAKNVVVLARWASGNGALDYVFRVGGEMWTTGPSPPRGISNSR